MRTRLPRCWFSGVSTPVWSWFSGVEPVCPGVAPPPRPPSTRSCFHRRSCRACGSSKGTLLGATLRASPARCFLAGPPQPPSAVPEVRARGSVRPPPFPAFTGHARPAARSLGGFRSVPRRSGARRGGQRAARATVPLYRGRPVLLQPTPLHTAPALRPLTARRPLQLPPTSQPQAHWGRLSWTTSGSGLAPGFSLPESPSVQSPACPRPCGAGRRMFPCVRRRRCQVCSAWRPLRGLGGTLLSRPIPGHRVGPCSLMSFHLHSSQGPSLKATGFVCFKHRFGAVLMFRRGHQFSVLIRCSPSACP